jgi:hypothetical protein
LAILMASSMAAISTDDIGLAAEMRLEDEMDMRLELDIDECDDRAEATDDVEGELERGVEISEPVAVLGAYDAMACAGWSVGERKEERTEEREKGKWPAEKKRRRKRTRLEKRSPVSRQGCWIRCC